MSFLLLLLSLVTVSFGWICEEPKKSLYDSCTKPRMCWPDDNDPNARGYKTEVDESDVWWSVPITDAYNNYGAMCLDGSMPHYYFRPGFNDVANNNDGTTKYYAYLEGGGWCAGIGTGVSSSMDTCDHRATTNLGSTVNDAPTITNNGQYLSNDMNENPVLYNWNGLYIRYCDGASYSGSNDTAQPVTINGNKTFIYYRGARIIRGIIESILNNDSLATPTEFLLTGCSAGGLGTYLHADFFIDSVNAVTTLKNSGAMPDSGYFMEYEATPTPNYVGGMKWVYINQNSSASLSKDCLDSYDSEDDKYNCIFAQNISPFVKTRLFPLQSIYDAWQLPNILGTTTNDALCNEYGQNVTDSFNKQVLQSNSKSGAFLSSCYYHCNQWDTIHINNTGMAQAMYNWYYGVSNPENNDFEQIQAYPCDTCCS